MNNRIEWWKSSTTCEVTLVYRWVAAAYAGVTILLQRVNYIRPSMHQIRSPQCFRYGINELKQILFEVGMRSEIERVIEDWNDCDGSDVDHSHFLQQSLNSSYVSLKQ